jgi:hypothetical protein
MALTITEDVMRSPETAHTAQHTGEGYWLVSWLPGRTFTQSQAVTAMTIAEAVGRHGVVLHDDPIWPHIDGWAAELGLAGPRAVWLASESPDTDGTGGRPR